MKHPHIQPQAFQPQQKRVRKHAHPTPQNKPQPAPAESSLDLLTKTALVLLGLMALLAVVPVEWLQ
jgi:hypothetical protein